MSSSSVRIVFISDTHNHCPEVPNGDVLIHCGDGTGRGTLPEIRQWGAWLRSLPHAAKVVIAGNHDRALEQLPSAAREALGPGVDYLESQTVTRSGLRIYGSPYTPRFFDWAFARDRGPDIAEVWQHIPFGLDVLVTHGPSRGILDRTEEGLDVGCADLSAAIAKTRPRVHAFGHIHEGYGTAMVDGVLRVNASICTRRYSPTNSAIVVDIPVDRGRSPVVIGTASVERSPP